MKKIEVTCSVERFIKEFGASFTGGYFYIPIWFKETHADRIFELYSLDSLPENLHSAITKQREGLFVLNNDPVTAKGFINESGLVFSDISSEKRREYGFPNGKALVVDTPLLLHVSKSGGHRIFTEDGWSYYIQPKEGWWIKWLTKKGEANF